MEQTENTVDQIKDISEAIVNYGAPTVILAVFLVLFIVIIITILVLNQKQINSILKQYQEQSDAASKQNAKIIESLMEDKEDRSKKGENYLTNEEIVKNYIDIQIVFKQAAKLALTKVKADRIGIYVFHNGNSSAHGFPFFKMSCVGEWIVRGVGMTQKIKYHAEMPLYVFNGIVEKIYRDGYFENLTDFNREISTVNEFTDSTAAKHLYMLGIYDDFDNLAGFTVAEFKNQPTTHIDDINTVMDELNNSIRSIIVNAKLQERLEKD